MSSILKVDTIQDQNGNLIISKDSGGAGLEGTYYSSSSPKIFTVTVAAKTANSPYFGVGSSLGYYINGIQTPVIDIKGHDTAYPYYYKFDQSDASNSGHPLRFYLDAAKTQIFSTNVTTNGTPGSSGAYTQIKVGGYTPNVLYYQCSNHGFMGNKLINPATKTLNLSGAAITLPTGTGNPNQFIGYSSSSAGVTATTWSTVIGETKPTITGISPNVAENTQTQITITGTNYVNTPYVDAINSTGAITSADSVSFTSATTLVTNFTLPVDGTYFIRIENPDGNAVRSSSAILTVSDAPAWQTAAGSLGTVGAGESISFTVNATNATAYAIQSGSLPGGGSLNTSTGAITGTESGATQDTTYNFTIRATDAQAQTADRAFSIAVSVGISNAMRFD